MSVELPQEPFFDEDLSNDKVVQEMLGKAQKKHDASAGQHTEDEVAHIIGTHKNLGTAAMAANLDADVAASALGDDLSQKMEALKVHSAIAEAKSVDYMADMQQFESLIFSIGAQLRLMKKISTLEHSEIVDINKEEIKQNREAFRQISNLMSLKGAPYLKGEKPCKGPSMMGFKKAPSPLFEMFCVPLQKLQVMLKKVPNIAAVIYNTDLTTALGNPIETSIGAAILKTGKTGEYVRNVEKAKPAHLGVEVTLRDISLKAKVVYNTFISKFLSVGINFILYNLSKNKNPESRKQIAELMNMTQDEVRLEEEDVFAKLQGRLDALRKGGKRKTRKYKKRRVKKSKTRKGKKSRKHKSKTHKRRKHRRGRKSRKH